VILLENKRIKIQIKIYDNSAFQILEFSFRTLYWEFKKKKSKFFEYEGENAPTTAEDNFGINYLSQIIIDTAIISLKKRLLEIHISTYDKHKNILGIFVSGDF
jgi:hypothetical protein